MSYFETVPGGEGSFHEHQERNAGVDAEVQFRGKNVAEMGRMCPKTQLSILAQNGFKL